MIHVHQPALIGDLRMPRFFFFPEKSRCADVCPRNGLVICVNQTHRQCLDRLCFAQLGVRTTRRQNDEEGHSECDRKRSSGVTRAFHKAASRTERKTRDSFRGFRILSQAAWNRYAMIGSAPRRNSMSENIVASSQPQTS